MKVQGRVLVSGASGFVGRRVLTELFNSGIAVRAARRHATLTSTNDRDVAHVGDIDANTDWRLALENVNAVVHCAARVHVLNDTATDPLAAFRAVNVAGTLRLAQQAQESGVRRFVFISSIGVNGAETSTRPFTADDLPAPHSPYAQSKHEAEVALRELAKRTGLEVTIIRPPLVFGPGAPGNFDRLMRALHQGTWLPFGSICNRRSLVALGNLTSLVQVCLSHPQAANQTFMVSDGEDISTTDLLRRLAEGLGRPARLISVPSKAIRAVAGILGKAEFAQRLCGSLQVDISKTKTLLGWEPPVTLGDALNDSARQYLAKSSR